MALNPKMPSGQKTTAQTSRLPELIAGARTPLDILCALAEDGIACGFNLWAMATVWQDIPTITLCSIPPLSPTKAVEQLSHFVATAAEMDCEGDLLMPDWSVARQQVICLRPHLPPLREGCLQYQDTHVYTGEPTGVILRTAVLGPYSDSPTEPVWSRLPLMIQYITPTLRALRLSMADTAHGMIDVESGVYSWAYFMDAVEREMERARRTNAELSLAVLELKPLKILGDIPAEIQRRIGEHVVGSVRKTDIVGRLGRNTFAIFFAGTGPRSALIGASRIADALKADEALRGLISFSLGVSGWDGTGSADVPTLLTQASEAAAEAALVSPGSAFVYI